MEIIAIAGSAIGAAGFVFGLRCYLELRRWARQCQGVRIAVAYKRKVKMEAPLTEWIGWANMLGKDQQSTGRVVYRMGGTSVAILKPRPQPKQPDKTETRTVKEAA